MEKTIDKLAEANGADSENFNWQTGEQGENPYIRATKLPERGESKAAEFVKGGGEPLEIQQVKRLGTVSVRRPKRSEWFRSHPEMLTEIFLIHASDTYYVVHQSLSSELAAEIRVAYLIPTMNHDGELSLWPIIKPNSDGTGAQLFDQALEDLELSRSGWIRRQWDRGAKTYRIAQAKTDREPEWPENPILDWVEKAFKGCFIDSVEHPVVRRLRGESL